MLKNAIAASGEIVDPDVRAFWDSSGITDATQKNAIKTLVKQLKDSSLWTKVAVLYPFVGGSPNTQKWNIKPSTYKITWQDSTSITSHTNSRGFMDTATSIVTGKPPTNG